jgi:hypothetical protein
MSLTINQITNFHGFPKAAELIEITGTHGLEASDRAIYNHMLQIAHDSGKLTEPDAEWMVTLATLRRECSRHESNDRIRDSLRRIRRTEVVIRYISARTGKARILETNLLTFTDTDEEDSSEATIEYSIPKRLRVILERSNRWGRIRCAVSYAMTSKYAIALYEMLCLRANMDRCVETIDIQKFRDLLGVPPGAYERGLDFQRKVVEPAVLEVNKLSDLSVAIDLKRRHARAPIASIVMGWSKKSGEDFHEVQRELNRSKVGRTARLRNQVEQVRTPMTLPPLATAE